jgi:hypothetical protein
MNSSLGRGQPQASQPPKAQSPKALKASVNTSCKSGRTRFGNGTNSCQSYFIPLFIAFWQEFVPIWPAQVSL